MNTLQVGLGERSYPIFIGEGLLNNTQLLMPYLADQQVMIVTNTTVAPLYLNTLSAIFSGLKLAQVLLPDGEKYKTLKVWQQIIDKLLENKFNRKVTLVALGGGVVGDMTGFAAAAYQRGVPFIQVPTTLLAMVDSSVGGKTGVNHDLGKNMIGAFHQPKAVVIDINTLDSLDDRQLSAGIAEVIKYGIIRDKVFFEWLEKNMTALLARDKQALIYAIQKSCQCKADIVEEDELENGVRALLNYGHTFGHAIETAIGYGVWLHGEAVATGMVLAAKLSTIQGWLNEDDCQRIIGLIKKANLPIDKPQQMAEKQFMEIMAVDKKVLSGDIRLVLLDAIGCAKITSDYNPLFLQQVLR